MLKTLLQLIPQHPFVKVLVIGNDIQGIAQAVTKHLVGVEGSVDISLLSGNKLKSREYEIVVMKVSGAVTDEMLPLKKVYTSLENSGIIIVDVDEQSVNTMISLLEKYDFRVPNVVEKDQNRALVVAKKLHMWGNGL